MPKEKKTYKERNARRKKKYIKSAMPEEKKLKILSGDCGWCGWWWWWWW